MNRTCKAWLLAFTSRPSNLLWSSRIYIIPHTHRVRYCIVYSGTVYHSSSSTVMYTLFRGRQPACFVRVSGRVRGPFSQSITVASMPRGRQNSMSDVGNGTSMQDGLTWRKLDSHGHHNHLLHHTILTHRLAFASQAWYLYMVWYRNILVQYKTVHSNYPTFFSC